MICHLGNMAQDSGIELKIDTKSGRVRNNLSAMKNWKREYADGWEPKI